MQTRRFELCFVQPTQALANAGAVVVASGMDLVEEKSPVIHLRVRAYDRKSYQYCLLAVKKNFFGLINRKWFMFVDVQTGVRYGFESTEVANEFGFASAVLTIGIHKVSVKAEGIEVKPAQFEDWAPLRAIFGIKAQSEDQGKQTATS